MESITIYFHRSNQEFCSEVSKKLSFSGLNIVLSTDKIDIASNLLIIFYSQDINLSPDVLNFIEKNQYQNKVLVLQINNVILPSMLEIFPKISIISGALIETTRIIINHITTSIYRIKSPEFSNITVRIYDISSNYFLGSGTIVSAKGDVVTSTAVLQRSKLIDTLNYDSKFRIVFSFEDEEKSYDAKINKIKTPFNLPKTGVALLKLINYLPSSISEFPKANLIPFSENLFSLVESFTWIKKKKKKIRGKILNTYKNLSNDELDSFIFTPNDIGVTEYFIGSPVSSKDNNCIIGVIIQINQDDNISSQYLCCTSSFLKRRFGIKTIFDESEFDSDSAKIIGSQSKTISDQPSKNDYLGYKSFTSRIATFCSSNNINLPVTVGLFGKWGTGKSTMFELIEQDIKKSNSQISDNINTRYVNTVSFNAWKNNEYENIKEGLINEIFNSIHLKNVKSVFLNRIYRFWFKRLRDQIVQIKNNLCSFIFSCVILLFLIANFVFSMFFSLPHYLSFIGLLISTIPIIPLLPDLIRSINIYGKRYGRKNKTMMSMTSDLEYLQKKMNKKNQRILIFIDDLDRCNPSEIYDILQTINLLLNYDIFIVFVAVDPSIISKAIQHFYKETEDSKIDFRQEFIKKIIHIPLKVKALRNEDIFEYIRNIIGYKEYIHNDANNENELSTIDGYKNNKDNEYNSNKSKVELVDRLDIENEEAIKNEVFISKDEMKCINNVINVIEKNPRHIKRLINIYFLIKLLYGYNWVQKISPEKIFNWIIICEQWPQAVCAFIREMDNYIITDENTIYQLFTRIQSKIDKWPFFESYLKKLNFQIDQKILQEIINLPLECNYLF